MAQCRLCRSGTGKRGQDAVGASQIQHHLHDSPSPVAIRESAMRRMSVTCQLELGDIHL
jgi:hypothetical protein